MITRPTGLLLIAVLLHTPAVEGQISGPEFRVNEGLSGTQRDPDVAVDAAGNSVIVWTRIGKGEDAEDVYVRRFNAAGSPLGGEVRVHGDASLGQFTPAVAVAPDGRFVVAWTSHIEGKMLEVRARMFGADGTAVAEEFTVNTTPDSSQASPAVAADDAGNFCIVWHSWFQDGGDRGVYGRCFRADG
ncbi:MAG: hypothetical protein R3178_04325, partial [Rhodothermales bacterium]|nr:hypothetical protein [Rhodothermales bacterium]